MAECDKVCKYIDLPLQHASNAVLKRMKRPGTRQTYDTLLDPHPRRASPASPSAPPSSSASRARPRPTSTSCAAFIGDHAFDHVGVFTYSHEEGTSALRSSTTTCRRGRRRRGAARVMSLQKRLVQTRQQRAHRRAGPRLVDGPSADHELVLKGRLATQAPDIDASVYLTDCDPSSLPARAILSRSRSSAPADYDLHRAARPGLKPASARPCYNFGFEGLG